MPTSTDPNVIRANQFSKSSKLMAPATADATVQAAQPAILAAVDCQEFKIFNANTLLALGRQSQSVNKCDLLVITYQDDGTGTGQLVASGSIEYLVPWSDISAVATMVNGVYNLQAVQASNPVSPTALPPTPLKVSQYLVRSDL